MDIREYMFRHRITAVKMAKDLECSRQLIVSLRAGKNVSKRFAKDIERYTNGEVSLKEIPHTDFFPKDGDKAA